jgi:hypothetical protein
MAAPAFASGPIVGESALRKRKRGAAPPRLRASAFPAHALRKHRYEPAQEIHREKLAFICTPPRA